MRYPRKLIESVMPLEAINEGGAHEKNVHSRHPSSLHLWWARRPLTVARAVLFAQCVDDPEDCPDRYPTEAEQQKHRKRLLDLTARLARWGNSEDAELLREARNEIWAAWRHACARFREAPDPDLAEKVEELFNPDRLPAVHDPFAGGGSIPIEARRLGFEAWASDLNPVAVLINRFMLEVPPRFAGRPPVNPRSRRTLHRGHYRGVAGLAEDLRYYGERVVEATRRIVGQYYPAYRITPELAAERPDLAPWTGKDLTVQAWLWVRTVPSPNPAIRVDVPLATSFLLCPKGDGAWVEPVIGNGDYRFTVRTGKTDDPRILRGTKTGRGSFRCLLSGAPIPPDYLRAQARAGRLGARLMAIVAEPPSGPGKLYLPPTPEHETAARNVPEPEWKPEGDIVGKLGISTPNYGMTRFEDLFTPRQLLTLTTLSDQIRAVMAEVRADAAAAWPEVRDDRFFTEGGAGPEACAHAIATGLAFALDKCCDRNSALTSWDISRTKIRNTFGRQALPMVWDYAEAHPLGESSGGFLVALKHVTDWLQADPGGPAGHARQADAAVQALSTGKIISTDPPYFDNIAYADLSDFFYVWLRPTLREVHPDLMATLAAPKAEEIVAAPDRHGGREQARRFFLEAMTQAMARLAEQAHPAFPITLYYAYKQSETDEADAPDADGEDREPAPAAENRASTGWEVFLESLIKAGLTVTATWPVRTERAKRMRAQASNALASSIVLACRRRPADAPAATYREFLQRLRAELPPALARLREAAIAPVDLAQAAIGPGMAVFTRYAEVRAANGRLMTVRDALKIINCVLDEVLAKQDSDFDAETRWAIAWFEEHGFEEGLYGNAETLAKAKNISVGGLVEAGILKADRGRVRLYRPEELPTDWDPLQDPRMPQWEMLHHLIRVHQSGGETGAARLLKTLGSRAACVRDLAYRLYNVCERKKWAGEGLLYDALIRAWRDIEQRADEGDQLNLM